MLARLGAWLQTRFPERKVVGDAEFSALIHRIENLEQNSVHKDAVKTLVLKLKEVQDEFATVKAGLGVTTVRTDVVQAMLNGQAISQGDEF